jgi:hypothetical protein
MIRLSDPSGLKQKHLDLYVRHIEKWGPLIEANHSSIYSKWDKYMHNFFDDNNVEAVMMRVLDTPLIDKSQIKYERTQRGLFYLRLSETDLKAPKKRYDAIRLMYNSYRHQIEETTGYTIVSANRFHDTPSITRRELIEAVEEIRARGYNPFDIIYYTTTKRYHAVERLPFDGLVVFILSFSGIAFMMMDFSMAWSLLFFVSTIFYIGWVVRRYWRQ